MKMNSWTLSLKKKVRLRREGERIETQVLKIKAGINILRGGMMNVKKKIKFKILNRENPEIERLRQQTFEVAKTKARKREEFDDSGKRCIDPLLLKQKEEFAIDLNYSLGCLPEKYRHLEVKGAKAPRQSKTGWKKL